MLKTIYLLLFILVNYVNSFASNGRSSTHPVYTGGNNVDGATRIIDLILETVGLQASFEVRKANVPNAAAVVYAGKRYILYNPSFIAAMDKAAGTPWASVAVLAHEIGHHLSGHTMDGYGSMPAIELEADEFSGYALRKLGASLPEAQVAMRIIAGAKATRTHPARTERLLAIASGWKRADEQIEQRLALRRVQPYNPYPGQVQTLAFDVYLDLETHDRFYVTTADEFIQVSGEQVHCIGKLIATGRRTFPLALKTKTDEVLLINTSGRIIDNNGNVVGQFTPHK